MIDIQKRLQILFETERLIFWYDDNEALKAEFEEVKIDRDVMMSYAQDGVEIDLDDGVKVNYCKFADILYEFDKKVCK